MKINLESENLCCYGVIGIIAFVFITVILAGAISWHPIAGLFVLLIIFFFVDMLLDIGITKKILKLIQWLTQSKDKIPLLKNRIQLMEDQAVFVKEVNRLLYASIEKKDIELLKICEEQINRMESRLDYVNKLSNRLNFLQKDHKNTISKYHFTGEIAELINFFKRTKSELDPILINKLKEKITKLDENINNMERQNTEDYELADNISYVKRCIKYAIHNAENNNLTQCISELKEAERKSTTSEQRNDIVEWINRIQLMEEENLTPSEKTIKKMKKQLLNENL
jgi:hypothetical protein